MNSPRKQILSDFEKFINTALEQKLLLASDSDAQAEVLSLFHSVADTVPAYEKFLKENHIEKKSIQTFADFQALPLTNKDNYLKKYPLTELCRQGALATCDLIYTSSGSTGKPTFFARSITDEFAIVPRFEQIFRDSFQAHRRTTLAVVCFPLGTWVGGIYTASCCRHLAAKGYPITVITPGNNQTEILRMVQELGTLFEQVVLLGYPPFLKEVIDNGRFQGMDWGRYSVKLVMAGEVISEQWRTLVGERLGMENPIYDTASLYGTADAGVLGNETPLSICIRRFLAEHPDAARSLFGESRLPTLVQYDPTSRFFETVDSTLLFSGDNGIPLIRYHISDRGGIITYQSMIDFLREWSFTPSEVLGKQDKSNIIPLPFVYVFGRSHFVVSYFGANIYPENVAVGLEQPLIRDWVTGKFVMKIKEDEDKNPVFSVVVELASGVENSLDKQELIAKSIQANLLRLNSEFANYVPQASQYPEVTLLRYQDPNYFPVGVKHRYSM